MRAIVVVQHTIFRACAYMMIDARRVIQSEKKATIEKKINICVYLVYATRVIIIKLFNE